MAHVFRTFKTNLLSPAKLLRRLTNQGAYSAGHYYSPIPSEKDILDHLKKRTPPERTLPGIDLNEQGQYKLLNEYTNFYSDLPFPAERTHRYRYFYENDWFGSTDAVFLYSLLRKYAPKRIVEVGSGFSSAVMLDTVDEFFTHQPDITFIEPFPDRLTDLIREEDKLRIKLIGRKVQEAPIDIFTSLEDGDLLFIDSSHVIKCGSDLQTLIFDILPRLSPGVIVHFHDVFYPFDYPSEWLLEGRYWNENYFLRAFLSYNSKWTILFFNSYASLMFPEFIKENMPLCTKSLGGSLYIQRRKDT